MSKSLQDQYAPSSICYGCGPANENGFQIKSFVEGDKVIAHWKPKDYLNAFPNVLNGGVIGTLLDCHCNWAAAYYLMKIHHLEETPCTVTAEYRIKLLRPTPMKTELTLEAKLSHVDGNRATIDGQITIGGKTYDTCKGVFVSVKEGHPAFHRW